MYNQLIQSYLLRYLQFNQRLMPFANVNYNLPTNYNLMPMLSIQIIIRIITEII